ncbi:cellobiohydrolase II [Pseudohyphozyma bogoriensis]|nr:cellobiohydrolase II [Pseudohyphozyma bogoriensis]
MPTSYNNINKCTGTGGSDDCTPYTVTSAGATLPNGSTYPAYGHVNYQAISCSQYTVGQTYLNHTLAAWSSTQTFGTNFDPNNNQPGGVYIGKSVYDWGLAAAA